MAGGKSPSSKSSSLPESISWRVTRSWELVADKAEKVGVDFFLRLFEEHPQAADLFHFGGSVMHIRNGKMIDHRPIPKALKVHSLKVMDAVGACVAGLTHLPDLVPILRSLGQTHRTLGVQNFHYDVVYKHLMNAIEAEVGSEAFDADTREAWEIVYRSLTTVMKHPSEVLQMEPLEGWGVVNTVACAYLVIFTPLQMAGLTSGNPLLDIKLSIFSTLAAIILTLDMLSHWVAAQVRPSSSSGNLRKRSKIRKQFDQLIFPLKFRTIRFLRSLQMDRWTKWHGMETLVLASFPLQFISCFLPGYVHGSVGVHWTYMFGLLRLAAASRVVHSLACAENNLLLRRRQIDPQELSVIRMTKLIATMLVVIHVNACLWCIVARVELGIGTVDPRPSEFFPKSEIWEGKLTVMNSYLHAVHWAWVSLAGIGDCDSTPESSFECLTTLFVHICGATLYTITTGNVVAILEAMTAKQNETGSDLAELGHFMQTCHVPQEIQKRIMQGYMMQQLMGNYGGGTDDYDDDDALLSSKAPECPDAVARLPGHLRSEMATYTRAEAIRRRDPAFLHCSHEFLVAFVISLKGQMILLSEDDYVLEGQNLPRQVALLVDGTMEVLVDDICVRCLQVGDLIGKQWLLRDETNIMSSKSSMIKVGLRADTTCTLITGLQQVRDIEALKDRYPKDFSLLRADRGGVSLGGFRYRQKGVSPR